MLAAMASQTVFRKLGNAVWDAFIGSPSHSSSSSSSSSSTSSRGDWDADKVRRVLEGKAVLRVVDVEPAATNVSGGAVSASVSNTHTTTTLPKWKGVASLGQLRTSSTSSNIPHATEEGSKMCSSSKSAVCDILEESMRSLTLGKKM